MEDVVRNLKKIFFVVITLYLMNSIVLENTFPILSKLYMANVIVIIFSLVLIVNFKKILSVKINKIYIFLIYAFIFMSLIGLISTYINKIQPIKSSVLDWFLFSRYMIIYIYILFFIEGSTKKYIIGILLNSIKIWTVLNFILLIFNLIHPIFPVADIRFGLPSQQLLYLRPVNLATLSYVSWIILSKEKNFFVYQGMALILALSTLRSKIIILLLAYFLYKAYVSITKNTSWIFKISGLTTIIFILILNFKSTLYLKLFNTTTAARSILLRNGIKVAKDYFPMGAGFATFGSYSSFVNYSPLYEKLGMNHQYGFLRHGYYYGMDSYFSMIVAQFGFIGMSLFLSIIFLLLFNFRMSDKYSAKNGNPEMLIVLIIVSLFTDSLLNTDMGLFIFLILGLLSEESYSKLD